MWRDWKLDYLDIMNYKPINELSCHICGDEIFICCGICEIPLCYSHGTMGSHSDHSVSDTEPGNPETLDVNLPSKQKKLKKKTDARRKGNEYPMENLFD